MPRAGFFMVVAVFLSGPIAASAQEALPATRTIDVPRLIERLDSDDFATREEATRQIALMGDGARAALLAAREAGSLERRMRIDQILQGFGAHAASRPARREPTLVTVEAERKPLSEVCATLSQMSGYPIRLAPGGDPIVTLSAKQIPFFQAIDLLCAQCGRRADWDMRERALILQTTTEKQGPTVYAGPLRVSLVMLTLSRQIWFGGKTTSYGNLQIRVDAEEKSHALGLMMPLRVKEFLDDQKRSLRGADPPQGQQSYVQRCDQRRQTQVYVPMIAPETDAKAISRLEFTLSALVPTELYEAEIQNPEEGSEAGQESFHVKVDQWKDGPAQREVWLSINRPVVATKGSPVNAVQEDLVTFIGPDGQTIQPFATSQNGSTSLIVTATLPLSPKVASVRVSCIKNYDVVDLQVVFENVPLP